MRRETGHRPAGHVLSRTSTPPASALTPAQLRSAYNLNGTSSGGRTVAIVDAYGYPDLARDLAVYRGLFGLPACTTSTGCLKILDENGGTRPPKFDLGWAQEQSLDVDAVSAACPDCRIAVVEARSASFTDLGAAEQTAAKLPGVVAISNSYGGSDASDATYGKYYRFPGIAVRPAPGTPATRAPPTRRPLPTSPPSAAPASTRRLEPVAAGPRRPGPAPGPAAPPTTHPSRPPPGSTPAARSEP